MEYQIAIMNRLLSVKETAPVLGLSEKGLRAWLAEGKIGYVKIGRLTKIPESAILEVIARGHHPAAK